MSAIPAEHTRTAPTSVLTKARLKWLAYVTLGTEERELQDTALTPNSSE